MRARSHGTHSSGSRWAKNVCEWFEASALFIDRVFSGNRHCGWFINRAAESTGKGSLVQNRIAAVHLTWEPRTSAEAQQTIARIVDITKSSQIPTLEGSPIKLTCADGVVGLFGMTKIARAQDQQVIQLSLTHPYHAQMEAAMRAQPGR